MGASASKKKKLTKEDLDFLLGNTNFTKKQIKQWYKGFMVSFLTGKSISNMFCSRTIRIAEIYISTLLEYTM